MYEMWFNAMQAPHDLPQPFIRAATTWWRSYSQMELKGWGLSASIGLVLFVTFLAVHYCAIDKAVLVIYCSSSESGLSQVFLQTSRGYNETDSRLQSLQKGDRNVLRFPMPSICKVVRWDPCNGPFQLEVRKATLVTRFGRYPIEWGMLHDFHQIELPEISHGSLQLRSSVNAKDPLLTISLPYRAARTQLLIGHLAISAIITIAVFCLPFLVATLRGCSIWARRTTLRFLDRMGLTTGVLEERWISRSTAALMISVFQWIALFIPIALGIAIWTPFEHVTGLDPSWRSFLMEASVKNLQFGTDIVFTYGPLGYVDGIAVPVELLPAWWGIRIALCAILASALLGLVTHGKWPFWASLMGVVATVVGVLGFVFVGLVIAYRLTDENGRPHFGKLALVVGMAFVGLIKFSYFLAGLSVLLLLDCETVLRHRRLPWMLATWLASTLLVWVCAGQDLLNFPAYISTSLEVAKGYSEAMCLWAPTHRMVPIYGSFFATTTMLLVGTYLALRTERWWRLIPMLAIAALAFMLFKAGFVRHDSHELIARVGLLSLTILCLLSLRTHSTEHRPRLLLAAGLLLCVSHLWIDDCGFLRELASTRDRPYAFTQYGPELWDGTGRLAKSEIESKSRVIAQYPLPDLDGTVDVYNWELCVPLAYGHSLSNRPVVQSYFAYTPRLAQLNADHLRGSRAPDHLLMELVSIDGQLPALVDSLSWPEILSRYRSQCRAGKLLVLDRLPEPQPYRLIPMQDAVVTLGEFHPINAKPSDLLWLELDLKSTLFRKLALVAHKDAETKLHIEAGGVVQSFRILPSLAAAGFLLNPLVCNTDQFQELMVDHQGLAVERIRITSHSGFIQPEVGIKLYRLELAEFPVRDALHERSVSSQ